MRVSSFDHSENMQQNRDQRGVTVAAFYRFASLPDYRQWRDELLEQCRQLYMRGTILLAPEGINGTVSGSRSAIDAFFAGLRRHPGLADLTWKESAHEEHPFLRMKVKLKSEIVTMGVPGIDPSGATGRHVPPREWNTLLLDPEVTVIDTRNRYEVYLGTFEGAIDPRTESFRDFPEFVERNLDSRRYRRIAMFCTGGIRCEKASAYLLEKGFEQVYQLDGGILNYLESVPENESLWHGECFVFDDRVTVDHELEAGEHEICFNCRMPIAPGEKNLPEYERHVSCVHCFDATTDERRESLQERRRQMELARARGERHVGPKETTE